MEKKDIGAIWEKTSKQGTNYLYSKGACDQAIESFNEAYAEFKLEAVE